MHVNEIFKLTHLVEKNNGKRKRLYVVFIDLETRIIKHVERNYYGRCYMRTEINNNWWGMCEGEGKENDEYFEVRGVRDVQK